MSTQATSPIPPPASTSWEIGEALSVGVNGLREHWRVLIPATLIVSFLTEGISLGLTEAGACLGGAAEGTLTMASTGISLVLGAVLSAGMMKISVDTARGTKPRLASLLESAGRALPLIAAYVLITLAVFAGSVAFIVPGIVIAVGLSFVPMLVVDRKLPAGEAIRASWELLRGHKRKLFAFFLACVGMVMMFALPVTFLATVMGPMLATALLMVPVLILSVVMGVAHAWIYVRVNGQ